MKSILMQDICKRYGNNEVVSSLNLSVREGERLILLGPSGCGKSTTLRMIAGLENITSGTLFLGGIPANDLESGRRDVSMVFQNYALYPHMTVAENITYSLRVHRLPKAEIADRLTATLKMLELTGLEKRRPKDLSGGQRQRVALARALVKRAGYLLLDEPLSNLDAQLRVHARKELVKIHGQTCQTMVYVTHDQVEAMTVGDKIALLHQGKLQMLDAPKQVYNRPANVFTARFIGSPCCNVVEARRDGSQVRFGEEALRLPHCWAEHAGETADGPVYFGVRPEHLRISRQRMPNSIQGTVRYVEDYGNRVGVYIEVAGVEWISICESDVPLNGETVYLSAGAEHIHLFDGNTGDSLGYPDLNIRKDDGVEPVYQYQPA